MGAHSRRKGLWGRVLDPVFIGLTVLGVSLVGIALVSQSASTSIPIAEVPQPPVTAPDIGSVSAAGATSLADAELVRYMPPSVPVSLRIDAIGVRSQLHGVGLDVGGAIETPSGERYDEPAWYKHSPTPGSIGPAIIVGHVDSAAAGPSIFFRLGELTVGDRISVTRADGTIARFTVHDVLRFAKDDFPTELVYGDLDHAGLRLITCGGKFDQVAGHYEDNVVVFARLDVND